MAVMTIRDWYRDGIDVQARLPVLSTMPGHIAPAYTYWYYSDSLGYSDTFSLARMTRLRPGMTRSRGCRLSE